MATRDSEQTNVLGRYVQLLRRRRGYSLRGLAKVAGLDATGISRLEHGDRTAPSPHTLARLAKALEVDVADLYAVAGYEPADRLPAFAPYLRAKYDLPQEAVEQLAAHFELMNDKYRASGASDGKPHR